MKSIKIGEVLSSKELYELATAHNKKIWCRIHQTGEIYQQIAVDTFKVHFLGYFEITRLDFPDTIHVGSTNPNPS